MHLHHFLVAIGCSFLLVSAAKDITGKTYTTWDCCKPACAWSGNTKNAKGSAEVCDINNNPLSTKNGLSATSGCETDGTGFLCDAYVPTPTTDTMAYGFAAIGGTDGGNCCKCFQLKWTSGAAKGQSMIVQAVNLAGTGGDVTKNDIVILTPGGGVGPNDAGCRAQYGKSWGDQNGGVDKASACANLPQNLQGGCYWRFNWAKGVINGWSISYQQVSCPTRLTSISGCSA